MRVGHSFPFAHTPNFCILHAMSTDHVLCKRALLHQTLYRPHVFPPTKATSIHYTFIFTCHYKGEIAFRSRQTNSPLVSSTTTESHLRARVLGQTTGRFKRWLHIDPEASGLISVFPYSLRYSFLLGPSLLSICIFLPFFLLQARQVLFLLNLLLALADAPPASSSSLASMSRDLSLARGIYLAA